MSSYGYTGRGNNPDLGKIRALAVLIMVAGPALALWFFASSMKPKALEADEVKTVKITRDR